MIAETKGASLAESSKVNKVPLFPAVSLYLPRHQREKQYSAAFSFSGIEANSCSVENRTCEQIGTSANK
jgi:hypothetical protein